MLNRDPDEIFALVALNRFPLDDMLSDSPLAGKGGLARDSFVKKYVEVIQRQGAHCSAHVMTSDEANEIADTFWTYCGELNLWTEGSRTLESDGVDQARTPTRRPRDAGGLWCTDVGRLLEDASLRPS